MPPDAQQPLQESDGPFVLWINRETRAYEASSVSPPGQWERVEVVPLSVAEKLATALDMATALIRREGHDPTPYGCSRECWCRPVFDAAEEARAAYPREETTG